MRRFVAALLMLLLLTGYALAEEPARRALESTDLDDLEEFAGKVAPELDLQGILQDALHGELPNTEALIKALQDRLCAAAKDAVQSCGALIAPALLLAVMGCALPDHSGASAGAHFLILCTLLLGVVRLTFSEMEGVETCLVRVADFADAAAPPLAALMTAAGMTGSAALISPLAALIGGAAENLLLHYGLPLCRFALAMAVAGNLSDAIDLGRAYRLTRKTANWGAGLAVTLFTALTAIQGSVSAGMDGVAVRTAKYAVDSISPVIGSGISDAWDSYIGGIVIAKNAVGISGVALLLAAGLRPMLRTAALMVAMNLLAALMDVLGERRAARAAEQAAGVCQMLLTLCAAALTMGMILLAAAMAAGQNLLS
ncbi:MAG: hypothetical protein SPH82_07625 [Eubacteriales bacterium]|nr:hypothetical protein [Eubacteriales bacterium]